ncbi:MAG: hypothetical protein K6F35_11680 [Lachnospiraceae bacterium]|nr:hypothetical protein [Lachnospiraceae bacterium]
MRKYHKKQCLDMIALLEEAHGELAGCIAKHQTEEALGLLQQCQEGAMQIGTLIEGSEGEGTEEVHELEAYCEQVFRIHEDISAGMGCNMKQEGKRLGKHLVRVANGIRNALPSQKEVVFLPYKASMWDSLETVWRRADADPDCKAYVIPIPYYDKNTDGSFRERHYELGDFPADVPVVRYEDYDFEQRHPEAVYIHNPYDGLNIVTSVDPKFYSDKLKEVTDELVYIPYFVLMEIDPDNPEALKGITHFCTTPGVIHADRVIVQSEEMKRAYVNVLSQAYGEHTRKLWEDKIEGSGSPKVERVLSLKAEDFELPEGWKKVADKPDGSRKKIIFYNTGIAALLDQREKMLDKIERNLQVFRENQETVALLWRPHPLIEATIDSMLPALWKKYCHIVEEYRKEAWGIYDDSPNMDRAIAISDAYYGDMSSIVWLYQKTGKPIMIQNADV